ncbi:MAG TPA: hypothetical protein PKE68_01360, partial [Saprospiraceae bacterium]|nr:hypothetical protein [Saprospiraceae bacterium]
MLLAQVLRKCIALESNDIFSTANRSLFLFLQKFFRCMKLLIKNARILDARSPYQSQMLDLF